MERAPEEAIATDVVDCAFRIHRELGPGLLESAYKAVLVFLLAKRGYKVETELPIPVHFDGVNHGVGYKADIVVDGILQIELKSVEQFSRLHFKQVTTYLKLSGIRLGLLINFNCEAIKGNIRRIANGMPQ